MEGAGNEAKSIKRKEVPDYTFAFNDSRFADRTLKIVTTIEPRETCLEEDDDGNGEIEVRTVEVSSAILAESSQFFNKLFSSGMQETEQRHATIHISPSEKQVFIYLLKFIYGGTIETQSTKELLDVLILADKFEVPSCINGCINALDSVPMTMEFASLILCLPSSLLTTDVMGPIVKAAEEFLQTHFSKKEFVEEYMNLPLHIIEVVLKSDELHVSSEDYIYDFAINWANRHYHDQDCRREVFQNKLIKLMRFPQMTDYKLAEILSNEDMNSANALKLVSEALNFKGRSSSERYNSGDKRFCRRFYERRPIRVIELGAPETESECRIFCNFNEGGEQSSETFYMWGQPLTLSFSCVYSFYLYLNSSCELKFPAERPMEYMVCLRLKSSREFCEVTRGRLNSVNRKKVILSEFNGSPYVLNNVIYVQAIFSERLPPRKVY